MKRLFAALTVLLCAVGVVVVAPNSSFAGGGHGYRHDHGYNHNYGYRRYYGYGYRRHGYRRYYGPGFLFGFSYYGNRPYYGYPGYYQYPQVIYPQPAIQWNQPNRTYVAPPQVQQQQSPASAQLPEGCTLIREYRTQIMVGGKLVDAYGDACLREDGSWERHPPKIPPQ